MKVNSVAGEATNKALEDVISTAQKLQEELSRLTGKLMAVETVAEVTTAVELTDELSKKLQAELSHLTGKKVLLRPNVDESILGGMVIRLGDKVIDCSLRHQLDQMRDKLAGK
ncbi:MAG: ATP synthase F1 subunit delta [Actinomycetota bacterium]|nr:ATP synthase F1 subunit delta [Actinomycetota bacterium]